MYNNDFDEIIVSTSDYADIQIGHMLGSPKILFIKTGHGGSIYGYENKYLNFAQKINAKYGCSVLVSATIDDNKATYDAEMEIVAKMFEGKSYEINYVGVSKGGLIGCWYASEHPNVKKIIMVNAPLMINFHNKTLPVIQNSSCNKFTLIYGTRDPSCIYVPFVERYVPVVKIDGGDHNFKGKTKELFETIQAIALS